MAWNYFSSPCSEGGTTDMIPQRPVGSSRTLNLRLTVKISNCFDSPWWHRTTLPSWEFSHGFAHSIVTHFSLLLFNFPGHFSYSLLTTWDWVNELPDRHYSLLLLACKPVSLTSAAFLSLLERRLSILPQPRH